MAEKSVTERAAEIGAAALSRPEPAPMCVGDVLYDHDWTPIEAARAVLEAVDYEGHAATIDAIAKVLDRGIPDDRKLATVTRLVHDGRRAP